jgi:ribosome-associated translation inhibitor RaiA
MQNPVEIVLRGIPRSGALERYIGEQARKLDRVCDLLLSCSVVAEALHRQQQQGAQFAVRLNITLPGTEVVVNREHCADVYVAVSDAFDAAGLQLKDHMRRQGEFEAGTRSGTSHPRG